MERNWKVFSYVHDRRRNRLTIDRAEKLVKLHYNLRIMNKLKNIEWEEEMHAPFELDDEDVEDAPMVEDAANAGVGMIEDAA